jgi:hypothetical protein
MVDKKFSPKDGYLTISLSNLATKFRVSKENKSFSNRRVLNSIFTLDTSGILSPLLQEKTKMLINNKPNNIRIVE